MRRFLLFISLNCILIPVFGQPLTYDFNEDWTYSERLAPEYLFNLGKNLEIKSVKVEGKKLRVNYHYRVSYLEDSIYKLERIDRRDKRYFRKIEGNYVLTNKKGEEKELDKNFYHYPTFVDTVLNRNDSLIVKSDQYYIYKKVDTSLRNTSIGLYYRDTMYSWHNISYFGNIVNGDYYIFYSFPDKFTKVFIDSTYNSYYQKFITSKSVLKFELDSEGKVIYIKNSTPKTRDGFVGATFEYRYTYLGQVCIKQDEYIDGELKSVIEIRFTE